MTYLNGKIYRRAREVDRYFIGSIEIRDDKFFAISFADGRVDFTENGSKFQYKLTNHLINTTVLLEDKNGDGLIAKNINNQDASEVRLGAPTTVFNDKK